MWNQQLQNLEADRPKENGDTEDDSKTNKNSVSKRSSGGGSSHQQAYH